MEGDECERKDATFVPQLKSYPVQDDKIYLPFPRKIMSDEGICAAADCLGLSDNELTMVVTSVINAGGGNISQFTISCSPGAVNVQSSECEGELMVGRRIYLTRHL